MILRILNKKLPHCKLKKHLYFLLHVFASPLPVSPVIGTLSGTSLPFHACIRKVLCSGMILISVHAFPTGLTPSFPKSSPMPQVPGIPYARSASDNNGFSLPGNPCWISVPGNTHAFSGYWTLRFLFSSASSRILSMRLHSCCLWEGLSGTGILFLFFSFSPSFFPSLFLHPVPPYILQCLIYTHNSQFL